MSETINHFQNYVPINLPFTIEPSALSECWANAIASVDASIYDSLLDPLSMDEWQATIASMPNDKAPGPSMISYEMLKYLGPHAFSLLLNLINSCFGTADIPDLWRQAMVFPIPKPYKWKCQLKNTRPITLLEVIRKTMIKLLYNCLAPVLAKHHVLQGGNFAGLPGFCHDPISC
ncbi:reverse transcriptase family protein [Rhizophagus irregularis DAOM 181602=DAOM 197198]|uniref:Reverse transcriptase n=1 Tax=Rhizophagus irregularis (strain DAOM 197198w) TaxID=1432141 RepID=A0A015LH68_RHIIW|nr:hypothetical protein RirG_073730 [Rhizophagus irregularis DAOM 197198w]EXX79264.1 hypothetical protein RirG_007320 [Rhizophagus irregularis DAOM 197198w]GBC44356.1 reverse transcriptase family protein [Rhizophagus irregularis DAOM 181602=DAOM 197198]